MADTKRVEESPAGKEWKIIGAFGTTIWGLFSVYQNKTGDAIVMFVLSISFLLGELGYPSTHITKAIGGYIVVPLRRFFGYGDGIARILMIVIAVGGTALIVKKFFEVSLIPDSIDFIIKRGGISLLGVTVILYIAMVISKFSFELSHLKYDRSIFRHELAFYVASVLLCILWAIVNGGNGFWDNLFTSQAKRRTPEYILDDGSIRVLYCLCAVSFVWSICFALNVLSRIFEWYMRDRLEAK
ncbi:hypothetical protein N2603_11560 [Bradyrhizobium huanghuaihaiense]|uniref:hypothetical protein n=1 Tax=Bradyrhizobium huanghuaihaiense TaxID=990078 RepID=UPI0021AAA98F|nr:hypothetical protein [Bradyrhizobium sp. CB3035]UWU79062.1 hypothetical protein N2603_11560 [Bradyrhizobium sp. CB3035]